MPTYDFWLKIRLFGPFCLGLVNRFFSIFSRYFFRRKCYLRPLQHLAFLIKILSTELPSTPEYFSKVLSTGPPLGGECSIQLSYEDISDFGLKIRLSGTFQSFRIGNRLFNYLCFLDELLHPTFLDTFAFGGKLYNTYFDRFELSSSFSHSSKASGKPLP